MNKQAKRHLDKAAEHLTRGDQSYAKAADEIIAAKEADSQLSNEEIGKRFDKSREWVGKLVAWRTSGTTSPTPYTGTGRPHQDLVATRKTLREAPMEQVESILSGLPKQRQQAIGAAAGHEYLKAREQHDEKERGLTEQEKRARREAAEKLTRGMRQAVGGIAAHGIVLHLEQASADLKDMIDEGSLSTKSAREIEAAYEAFGAMLEMAQALLGS